ncbi:MAG: PDZ domain-containing protein [Nitrospirae bacterium]|nr:MAG: PDZ domain-containing protein [Nitrospirota bacterium]
MRMRVIGIAGVVMLAWVAGVALAATDPAVDKRNKDVIALAEEFGIIVGAVTEDIRKELNLRSAEGVAVLDIIGDSLAERAGIKVGAVIAEVNKKPVRNLDDFGKLLPACMRDGNCTVGTWEPTSPDNQGQGGQMNFHFVPKNTD